MRFVSALLLLLWILCDVSIFGSCQVPHEPGIRRVTATVISSLDHRIPTSVRAQNQHPPLSSCPIDQDDCWCSCGHILPGAVFSLSRAGTRHQRSSLPDVRLPSGGQMNITALQELKTCRFERCHA